MGGAWCGGGAENESSGQASQATSINFFIIFLHASLLCKSSFRVPHSGLLSLLPAQQVLVCGQTVGSV